MVERKSLLSLGFYEKSPFTGSDHSLRYRIEKKESSDGETPQKKLLTTAWYGPFAYDHTPDEEKITFEAEFSDQGMEDIVRWLNDQQ